MTFCCDEPGSEDDCCQFMITRYCDWDCRECGACYRFPWHRLEK